MNLIHRRNLWTYICLIDPGCVERLKMLKFVYPMLYCIVGAEHTCHNVFKGWEYIKEITELFKEDKVCLNSVITR